MFVLNWINMSPLLSLSSSSSSSDASSFSCDDYVECAVHLSFGMIFFLWFFFAAAAAFVFHSHLFCAVVKRKGPGHDSNVSFHFSRYIFHTHGVSEGALADIKCVYRMMCVYKCAQRVRADFDVYILFTHIHAHSMCAVVFFLFHSFTETLDCHTHMHIHVRVHTVYDRTEIDFVRTGSLVLSWLPTRAVSVTLLIEVGAINIFSSLTDLLLINFIFISIRETKSNVSFFKEFIKITMTILT